jgi:hypothetical protein
LILYRRQKKKEREAQLDAQKVGLRF